ncbi:MAG: ATP synthase F1 subunit delta [Anaerostipes sp.]|nr:ATP synthase F1 subunit delta [Anaerostipes sp.]
MRRIAVTYGKVLLELNISESSINESKEIFIENPDLIEVFENPRIYEEEKNRVIEQLFPKEIQNYLKTMIVNQDVDCVLDAISQWEEINREKKHGILAVYRYVTKPSESQISRIKEYLKKEYKAEHVELQMIEDATLIGGFILQVKDRVIDRSTKGKLRNMRQNIVRR